MLYHIISYCIISCRIISYCIMKHCIVSYHTASPNQLPLWGMVLGMGASEGGVWGRAYSNPPTFHSPATSTKTDQMLMLLCERLQSLFKKDRAFWGGGGRGGVWWVGGRFWGVFFGGWEVLGGSFGEWVEGFGGWEVLGGSFGGWVRSFGWIFSGWVGGFRGEFSISIKGLFRWESGEEGKRWKK